LNSEDLQFLEELFPVTKIFFIFECISKNEEDEKILREKILNKLNFLLKHQKSHYLLLYETMKGKVAFLRQIKPTLHFEGIHRNVVLDLKPHIPYIFEFQMKSGNGNYSIQQFVDLYRFSSSSSSVVSSK
jgi:hypothetical protein